MGSVNGRETQQYRAIVSTLSKGSLGEQCLGELNFRRLAQNSFTALVSGVGYL